MTIYNETEKRQALARLHVYLNCGDLRSAAICAKSLSDRYPEDRHVANLYAETASKNYARQKALAERAAEELRKANFRFFEQT